MPFGYILLPTGKVDFDPDEQACSVVRLLFEKFEELGTIYGLYRWLVHHGIALPIRPRTGPKAGQLEWRKPVTSTLAQMLHHPMYAGAYAYGRRSADAKRRYASGKGTSRGWVPIDQWQVLIRDRLPAYIRWEQYLKNLERMKQNRTSRDTPGTPRKGCALLCGTLVCGRCDWRMQVSYQGCGKPHYCCRRHWSDAHEPCGCGISATFLDEMVSQQVLRALEPAALELSRQALGDVRRERKRLERHWQQTLQRAAYDVEAAERRYRAVDPENRLVAATLEQQWEDALQKQREAKEEFDRFCRRPLATLTAEQESRIAALASDIPALWGSPKTTNIDRQAIIRCLVERVVLQADARSEYAVATIHWAGACESRIEFVRPVRTYGQLRDRDRLMRRIVELREVGNGAAETAEALNAEGFAPINPDNRFTPDVVRGLHRKLRLQGEINNGALLRPGEWWLHDLADELGMPWETLRGWAVRSWVHGRQTKIQKLWIIWADRDDITRLRKLRCATIRSTTNYPEDLTRPKHRPSTP